MEPVRFTASTPLLPAGPDLGEAIAFYTEKLGFTVTWQSDSMAGVTRGAVSFNLVQNDNPVWSENASVSIGVSDLDRLYLEYQALPLRVTPPELKFWGRREFHMIIPSGVCFQFYEQV